MVEPDQQLDAFDRPVTQMNDGADAQHECRTDGEDDHGDRAPDTIGEERRRDAERNRSESGPAVQQTSKARSGSAQETPRRCAEVFGAGIIEQGWRYLHELKGYGTRSPTPARSIAW